MSELMWARRPDRHDDPNIAWSRCNGCPDLTVKGWALANGGKPRIESGVRHQPYHCHQLHRELSREEIYEMGEDECPAHRPLKRRTR